MNNALNIGNEIGIMMNFKEINKMMKTVAISLLIGYFIGCILPLRVIENPNTLPFEQRQNLLY